MKKEISVGIWEGAPFFDIIVRGIEALNLLLESKEALVIYKVIPINLKSLKPIDILFFDGGADIDPRRYGKNNRFSRVNLKRDDIEFDLFYFYKDKVRMSGACRGHQLINVALGGNLCQDMRGTGWIIGPHNSPHQVTVKIDGLIGRGNSLYKKNIFGLGYLRPFLNEREINVSSLHHQCINRLGNGLYSTLIWRDSQGKGVIEGIESQGGIYRGLQSHPEFGQCKHDGYLFSYLLHVDAFAKDFFTKTNDTEQPNSTEKLSSRFRW